MDQLIPVRLDGTDFLIEATVETGGSEPTSRFTNTAEQVGEAFSRAQHVIAAIASSTVKVIRDSTTRVTRPDELEIEFVVKFSVRGDIIVGGGAAEAALKVKLAYQAVSSESTDGGQDAVSTADSRPPTS